MATEIENQVVSMHFDSEAFDRKLNETIKGLDRLKASLNFQSAASGMKDISAATQNVNMSSLANSIDGISAKFTAMSAVAITALATITTQAVQAGLQFAKSFTLGPIISGFKEFETQMTSVQTILANTASAGTNLQDVNAALDTMNTYSDKTIYNFGEMARNLGTFTAAGVDLKTSETSIKGIANLAALSGSNSEQASTAMYQLSQAIAAGSVKLMDWNSVVNAGMGGEVFKKALFESGKAMGKFGDLPMSTTFEEWEKSAGSFREQLQNGWLTADVLTTTLSNMTGDVSMEDLLKQGFSEEQANEIIKMGSIATDAATKVKTFTQLIGTVKESVGSGWSQSFRIMIGDFEQSKELWTGYNQVIGGFVGKVSDARNDLLEAFAGMGGRVAVIDTINQLFRTLGSVIAPIKDAFRDIFPPATAEGLLNITQGIFRFLKSLELSGDQAEKVRALFRGLFAAIEIGWTIFKGLAELLSNIARMFLSLASPLGGVTSKIGDFLTRLNKAGVEGGGILDFFHMISRNIMALFVPLDNFKKLLSDIFEHIPFEKATDGIDKAKKSFNDIFDTIGKNQAFTGITSDLSRLGNLLSNLFSNIGDTPTLDGLTKSFSAFQGAFVTLFKYSDSFGKITSEVGKFRDVLSETFDFIPPRAKSSGDSVQNFLDIFNNTFGSIGPKTKDFCDNLDLIKEKTGGATEPASKFSEAWHNVVENFTDVGGIFKKVGSVIGGFFSGLGDIIKKAVDSIGTEEVFAGLGIGLLGALTFMANGIRKNGINLFKFDFFSGIGEKVSGVLDQAGGALKSFQTKVRVDNLRKIAISIAILAASLFLLSTINQADLARALGAVAASMGTLIGALVLLEKMAGNTKLFDAGKMVAMSASMTLIAGALVLMAVAVKILGSMSIEEIARGIGAISAMMLALVGMLHLMPDKTSLMGFGAGLIMVAGALIILAAAVKIYSMMDFGTMIKGMGAIIIFLGGLGLVMRAFPTGGMVQAGAGLLLISAALLIMAGAIKIVGSMKLGDLAKALGTFTLLLIGLVIAANAMTGALIGAAAMVIMAGAMLTMAVALKVLGSMDMGDVATALAAIAGAIGIFVGFAALITAVPILIVGLMALGIALILIGAGFLLFGAGAYLAAKAFAIFAKSGEKGAKAFGKMLAVLGASLPKLLQGFAIGIGEMLKAIIDFLPGLIGSLGKVLDALINLIREYIPKIIQLAIDLVLSFLGAIRDNIKEIVTVGTDILVQFIEGITQNVSKLGTAGSDLIVALIGAISEHVDKMIKAGTDFIVKFLEGLTGAVTEIATAIGDLITTFIYQFGLLIWRIVDYGTTVAIALLDGMATNITKIKDSLWNFISAVLNAIFGLMWRVVNTGVEIALALMRGMVSNTQKLANAAGEFILALINAMVTAIQTYAGPIIVAFAKLGRLIMTSIGAGIKSLDPREMGKALGNGLIHGAEAILEVRSPSKVFIRFGGYVSAGLAIGIDRGAPKAIRSASNLSDDVITTFGATLSKIPSIVNSITIDEFAPVISPVLDLTGMKKDAKQIQGMMTESTWTSSMAFIQAGEISKAINVSPEVEETAAPVAREVNFVQNINAPTRLATVDIYRQTKGQIALAKEELKL